MNIENNIDNILNQLINRGCEIEYLKELRCKTLEIVKNKINFNNIMNDIAEDIKNETKKFLNSKNEYNINYVSGISSCIYFPDFSNNCEYKLKVIGGSRYRDIDLKIDENTMFDVASITKLYTLILLFKLEEWGYINLNDKIKDVNPKFSGLEDFTFNDLIRLHGELKTIGNIVEAKTKEEAYEILKTLYLVSNTREENKYTDFGAIVISDTIEKIVSEKIGLNFTFKEIMEKFLLIPLGLNQTKFNPNIDNLSGNGNKLKLVHDPKCRILGGAVGSAGLFTTSNDLSKLSRSIYNLNYINKNHLNKLGEITFQNSCKGNLGIYVKHPDGYKNTFTSPEFSTNSFSHEGWTGSIATFDPNNLIHQSILVNAIYENENKELIKSNKPVGFISAITNYQRSITEYTMFMYVIKQYYNRYFSIKEPIDEIKYIKGM